MAPSVVLPFYPHCSLYGIMGWFGPERTWKIIWFQPPCCGSNYVMCCNYALIVYHNQQPPAQSNCFSSMTEYPVNLLVWFISRILHFMEEHLNSQPQYCTEDMSYYRYSQT